MAYIKYYADNSSMGDTSDADCDAFRVWAMVQIRVTYPEHKVSVHAVPSLNVCSTNDEERECDIMDFCSRLWDRCPWDWQTDEDAR